MEEAERFTPFPVEVRPGGRVDSDIFCLITTIQLHTGLLDPTDHRTYNAHDFVEA